MAILQDGGAAFEIVDYLKTGLTAAEVRALLQLTGGPLRAMMRSGEAIYKQLDLKHVEDDEALIAALCAHPILLERPLLSDGQKAVVCRPPERVEQFL